MKTIIVAVMMMVLAADAMAQQRLWTWRLPAPFRAGVVDDFAVDRSGSAAVVLRHTDGRGRVNFGVYSVSGQGRGTLLARFAARPSEMRDKRLGSEIVKRQVRFMGADIVVSDGEWMRIFAQGKATPGSRRLIKAKGAVLMGQETFRGWMEILPGGMRQEIGKPIVVTPGELRLWRY